MNYLNLKIWLLLIWGVVYAVWGQGVVGGSPAGGQILAPCSGQNQTQ
jgi:hypothetical protein